MNIGGVAAVLPSTSTEGTKVIPNGMTYDDERLSERWKERRARFLGCIENTKLIAERTKKRQENARQERLKKERAEMEKYRQRYLEAAMKQQMEQQAKARETQQPSSMTTHAIGHHHPQQLPAMVQGYPNCMQVQRAQALSAFPANYSAMQACRTTNSRKRSFDDNDGWTQCAHMTTLMCEQRNMYAPKDSQMFQTNVNLPHMQMAAAQNVQNYQNVLSKQANYCAITNNNAVREEPNKTINDGINQVNCIVSELEQSKQYDQARLGNSMLPTTSQSSSSPSLLASSVPEEISNLSTMPELAESHMKDLMDQIGPGNSLDDLGGNCLEGVLVNRCDDEQPATETRETDGRNNKVQSTTNSIVSPISAPCDTPNSIVSPAHLTASACCSTNSFFDSQSATVTPQRTTLTPSCSHQQQQQQHHQQRITTMEPLPLPITGIPQTMAQENSLLYPRNANSTSSTSSIASCSGASLISLSANISTTGNGSNGSSNGSNGDNGDVNGIGNNNGHTDNMYNSNVPAVPVVPSIPPYLHHHQQHVQQQQQQQYPFAHQQQQQQYYQQQHQLMHQHHQHHQQQLANIFGSGYHMSANNPVPYPHLDNPRLYHSNEYPRFPPGYNPYSNNYPADKPSSIFPRFAPQALMRYPTAPQQYGPYGMRYPSSGIPYQAQQPDWVVQQQPYPLQVPVPPFQPVYQHQQTGTDPAAVTQNPAYPPNNC